MNRLEILGTGCTLRSQMRPPKCWRGGSAHKPKGQLGAAQDSLALDTKTLTRKNSFSGASHPLVRQA